MSSRAAAEMSSVEPLPVAAVSEPTEAPVAVESFDAFFKSDEDKCEYRLITLPNRLQALLVSDPAVQKASAALDVHIGSFADPDEIPGLAHFLEHLLFMGTEKYPKENEYSQYLNEHGGSSNAYTCEEHTNYFFDVEPGHLEGALDRFAQFFLAPLFDPSGTEREMRAVDSENMKNLNNDHWRLNQLDKHLSSHSHPYSKFGTGNLETLNKDGIRDTLIAFHSKHYSANLMKLVVYGRDSLDTLQEWTVRMFASIRNAENSVRPEWTGQPWVLSEHAQKLIRARTLKEMRSLALTWLISDQRPHYQSKPENYLTHLIGHEGEGSLFQALKRRGWVSSLSAACDSDAHGYNFLQVSMDLSPAGFAAYTQVIGLVFRYLGLLQKWGPSQEVWEECRQLADIKFRYKEKGDPSTYTHSQATWLQQYAHEPRLILAGAFIAEKYDAETVRNLVNELQLDNFRVQLAASEPFAQANPTLQTEPWYGTEFTVESLDEATLRSWKESFSLADLPDNYTEMHLPTPNPYIPQRFNTNPISARPDYGPKKLHTGRVELSHKADDSFAQPKSVIYLLLRNGLASSSARESVRARLFKEHLLHCVVLYDASIAGLHYDIQILPEGLEIRVAGFSDKSPRLLEALLDACANAKSLFGAVDFEVVKDKLTRTLQNFPQEAPYWHASYHSVSAIAEPFHSVQESLDALKDLELRDLVGENGAGDYWSELMAASKIDMLVHGSLTEEEALELAKKVESVMDKEKDRLSVPFSQRVLDWRGTLKDPACLTLVPEPLDNPNCAVEVYFPISLLLDARLRALAALFVQIFNEPFFDTLRTNEQLGYLIAHGSRERANAIGLRFLIQSERDPVFLESRIEAFLTDSVPAIFAKMTDDEFENHRRALQHELTKRKEHLGAEAKAMWVFIVSRWRNFMRPQMDAEMLSTESCSRLSLEIFHRDYLHPEGKMRRKLVTHIWSRNELSRMKTAYEKEDVAEERLVFKDRKELISALKPTHL